MPAAAAEFAYVLQNPGLNFVCGGGGVRLEQAHQALVSKFLIVDVSGLGDAVGVKNQAVSDSQLGSAEGESLGWENAENPPAFGEAVVRTVLVQDDGRIVSGIDVLQSARRAVEVGVEKGNEAVTRHIPAKQRIQARAQLVWAQICRGQAANGGL